jgi:two-component system LytT family response regulator
MSFRCVVVDDEKPARDRLKRLLAEHADFTVVGEAADADAAVRLIEAEAPDLCFLDVQMPEGSGFDVLRRLRRVPAVIFTTAYDQYAVAAFEVRSLDYLLKPFGRQRLAAALGRAREALGGTDADARKLLRLIEEIGREVAARPAAAAGAPLRLSGKRGARIVVLEPDEVRWFEAEETLVFARTAEGRFLVERTLAELEELLEGRFFRTHRAYLVNLRHVAEIVPAEAGTYEVVIRDGQQSRLPLSRRQARRLREMIPW